MPYAELHAHSNFSFLDGASHPEELVAEAVRIGLVALALTDHNGLYGVVRFAEAARANGLSTVFGAELTIAAAGVGHPRTGVPDPGGSHLVVLAHDPEGYARLSRVIALAHLDGGEKGRPIITLDTLSDQHGGHWQVLTGCRKGALATALATGGPGRRDGCSTSWSIGSAVTTCPSSCGTTGTRSIPPATTPLPCWPSSGGWPR